MTVMTIVVNYNDTSRQLLPQLACRFVSVVGLWPRPDEEVLLNPLALDSLHMVGCLDEAPPTPRKRAFTVSVTHRKQLAFSALRAHRQGLGFLSAPRTPPEALVVAGIDASFVFWVGRVYCLRGARLLLAWGASTFCQIVWGASVFNPQPTTHQLTNPSSNPQPTTHNPPTHQPFFKM